MAKPEIRLKGFEGEWEVDLTKNLCKIATGKSNTQDQVENGQYPFYIRSENIVRSNKYLYDCEAVITIGDGNIGRVFHYVNGKFDLHQRCYKMTDFERVLGIYFYYFFSANFYDRAIKMSAKATVDSVRLDMIADMPIYYPSDKKEQKSIADYFNSLDSMIQGVTKKIASLKQMKQACLVSMFPQEGETTPRVRFKGFKGDWVKVAMGDVFVERHEISTITNELPQLSFTIEEGVIKPEDRKTNKRDFLIKDKTNKKYLVTYVDDIIYNPANVIYGAIHKNSLCNGVVSPIYKIFYTDQDASFMECVVRKTEFIQGMTVYMEGTVQKLKTLKPEAFLQMVANIAPTKDEQKHIGRFFHSLDSQISLQEQRLEKLKQIKSACLDKMFV